ncbi:MAG: hypothetical protein MJA83_17840 [Gammaproteobacteria bacterium]|nr:hypothetical protein [Gammaproteobacteria bacterium]
MDKIAEEANVPHKDERVVSRMVSENWTIEEMASGRLRIAPILAWDFDIRDCRLKARRG